MKGKSPVAKVSFEIDPDPQIECAWRSCLFGREHLGRFRRFQALQLPGAVATLGGTWRRGDRCYLRKQASGLD